MARYHAAAAADLGCKISAAMASDVHSKNWQEWPYQSRKCATVKEVSENSDKIVVAVAWGQNVFLSRYALANKPGNCLLEKPVALKSSEVPTHAEALVGFNRRFYKPVQRLKERGTDGLVAVRCVVSEWINHHIATTGHDVIPHLLEFTSCHTFDLLLYLLGNDWSIESMDRHHKGLHLNGMVRFGDVPVWLSVNENDPQPIGLWFQYDDGETWVLSPLEVLNIYKGIEVRSLGNQRSFHPKLLETIEVDREYKPGIWEQMRAFVNGEKAIGASMEDQRNTLIFIENIKGLA